MIELRASLPEELASFSAWEQDEDSRDYVTPYTLERHRLEYARDDIVYLSIYNDETLAGFFILVLEPDQASVEFRRIVIAEKGTGVGQSAIACMEQYCRDELKRSRVWLDVFDFNQRGRHVYEKLGYRYFDSGDLEGKKLLFYEKNLR